MNSVTYKNIIKLAKEAWRVAEINDPEHNYGMGKRGRADWFAGYAAALDWVAQMLKNDARHERKQ